MQFSTTLPVLLFWRLIFVSATGDLHVSDFNLVCYFNIDYLLTCTLGLLNYVTPLILTSCERPYLFKLLILMYCLFVQLHPSRHLRLQTYWLNFKKRRFEIRWTKQKGLGYSKANFDMACGLIKFTKTNSHRWHRHKQVTFFRPKLKSMFCPVIVSFTRHKFCTGVFYRLPCTDISYLEDFVSAIGTLLTLIYCVTSSLTIYLYSGLLSLWLLWSWTTS